MALLIILGVIALLLLWIVGMYNGMVKAKIKIDNAWSDISVFLKKRFDLIPNLVNTVKGYAAHESQTLEKVVQARNAAVSVAPGDVAGMAAANQQLGGALRGLLAIAESYPDLKSNQNYLALQSELSDTENKIQAARRFYNSNVMAYNTKIQTVPTNMIAKQFNFTEKEFFELAEGEEAARNPVEVKF